MEESFIPGPMYFFDQSSGRQRPKRTRKIDKACKHSSINPQMESNKKSTRTKSVSDGESAVDDDLSGESAGKSERKGRCDALVETNDPGNSNDDERCTEAPPTALQEEISGEISLLEEYRHGAPLLLLELEQLLRMSEGREEGFFPRGLGNVLNYTWRELTDGASSFIKRQMQLSAPRFIKHRKPKGSVTSDRLSIDTPQEKTKTKKKSRKKNNLEENSLKSLLSTTISFSMSSEVCHEQGWVVQSKDLTLDPQWKVLCRWALERLQLAQILIKEQNAKLAEWGFTHPLVLRHYGEAKRDCAGRQRQGGQACVLPPNRPPIPEPRQEDLLPQKLHYRINDGTSFLYYPSGQVAVCQSHSGLPCGGFYTIVFGDAPKASILATFTPFGHGTMAHPLSGTVTVWNQCGGVTYESSGAVSREWTWSPDGRQNKLIVVEVTELISVQAWSVTSASLWFRADQERIQLPISSLPNLAPPKNLAEVRSSDVALKLSPEEVGCAEAQSGRRERADQDLRRLQRTVRNILEDWLEHYRQAMGSTRPAHPKAKDRLARSAHNRWKAQSAAPPAPGPAELEENSPTQPPGGSTEQLATARQGKEQPQHVTETGVLRVHCVPVLYNKRTSFPPLPPPLLRTSTATSFPQCPESRSAELSSFSPSFSPVVIPRGPETGHPATAPPSACPALTRAALQGQERPQQCHCSNRRMPLLTDLEYDTFIGGQPSHTEQVLVVCVTPKGPPTGDTPDQLYRAKNKNRSMPCTQCHLDSFRLVRYELPTADSPSGTHNSLLQHRNNIAPGMFLMYAGGRLLFADHIFNGYSCSARDLHKQIAKTREAYRQGHGLPSDFRFSPPVGAFNCADNGLPAPQGPRGKSDTGTERHTPHKSLLSRKRIPQTCDRAPAAQDAVVSRTLRGSLQHQGKKMLPVTLPILPTEQIPQRAGPRTLAPGCESGP